MVAVGVDRIGPRNCQIVQEAEALAAVRVFGGSDGAQRARVMPGRPDGTERVPCLHDNSSVNGI